MTNEPIDKTHHAHDATTATNAAGELAAPAPSSTSRPRSAIGVCMGAGLLLGFLAGIAYSRLFALTMFFGAALGAIVGAAVDARRRG